MLVRIRRALPPDLEAPLVHRGHGRLATVEVDVALDRGRVLVGEPPHAQARVSSCLVERAPAGKGAFRRGQGAHEFARQARDGLVHLLGRVKAVEADKSFRIAETD